MAYTFHYGNTIGSTWRTYMYYQYSPTYSATKARFHVYWGVNAVAKHTHTTGYDSVTYSATGVSSFTYNPLSRDVSMSKGENKQYPPDKLFEFPRKASAYTATVTVAIKHSGSGSKWKGTSTAKINVTVPALPKYTVSYNANGGSGAPAKQTKTYGVNLTLSSARPTRTNYTFSRWNTASGGGGTNYNPSAVYKANASATLYAQWSYDNPPTITSTPKASLSGATSGGKAIKNFTTIGVSVNAKAASGRTITSIRVTIGAQTATYAPNTATCSRVLNIVPNKAGTFKPVVTITDSAGKVTTYTLSTSVNVVNPTWTKTIDVNGKMPALNSTGKPILTKLEVWNYLSSPAKYDTVTVSGTATKIDDTHWRFTHTFDEAHVSSATSQNPTVKVRISYLHYDTYEKEYRKAFFSTTRNCNFSNGIYNTVFISGVEPSEYPNFTSRVWWCAINDPLYFPDTNYIEVGSNDTSVKGLAKVGNYLGAIKQSKTTDTAIYLIYPTSFDEQTTYAVKQGVQGVGALGKYTFNILGDETLFLSPNGVMAITPSEDDEHKVQNRSYYIDGKLLKEENLSDAYSFVYDGKYWLAVIGERATCYVLDGNQRNSWGNDRTVLVYECYVLDNVPAKCFAKYHDDLLFSTGDEICRFKRKTDADTYMDSFDFAGEDIVEYTLANLAWYEQVEVTQEDFEEDPTHFYKFDEEEGNYVQCEEGEEYNENEQYFVFMTDEQSFLENPTKYFTQDEEGEYTQCEMDAVFDPYTAYYTEETYRDSVPVRAEWSTLLDDDGALHYYKTMQKKGNVVSILPLANETGFIEALITQEDFNANKTMYYTKDEDTYRRCKETDEFDDSITYYVEHHSSTKVYVKKDGNDEIEIQRKFSRSSRIPSEMVLRKKVKKYKRLQFILRNNAPEDFGVDQIVKTYLVKSYAKK